MREEQRLRKIDAFIGRKHAEMQAEITEFIAKLDAKQALEMEVRRNAPTELMGAIESFRSMITQMDPATLKQEALAFKKVFDRKRLKGLQEQPQQQSHENVRSSVPYVLGNNCSRI